MTTRKLWGRSLLMLTLLLSTLGGSTLAAPPDTGGAPSSALSENPVEPPISRAAMVQASEWDWQNPVPQGNALRAAWGTGPNDVFAVGDCGTILRYDGGQWHVMDSGTTRQLNGVWGSSSTNVFAVGAGGTILRYDGSAWSPMSSGTSLDLNGIWGGSASNVFAVGSNGTIQRYDGAAWRAMNSGTSDELNGLWGSSGDNVFAVGDNGTVRRYDGTTWYGMTSNTSWNLKAVWGSSATSVYAVGELETMLRYNGITWTVVTSGYSHAEWTGVWGTGSNDVYVLSNFCDVLACGGTIRRFDGSELSEPVAGGNDLLFGIWGGSASDVFAVGEAGIVIHYDGEAWAENPGIRTGLHSVWGSSGDDVWTVGPEYYRGRTTTLRYDGTTWNGTEYTMEMFDLWGNSASDIFAVGGYWDTVIMHYDGHEWSEMTIAGTVPTEGLNGVWGSSGTSVFAVGVGGTILHYDGANWDAMTSGTSSGLQGVWGSDDSHVFVVGDYGTILRYDGSAWYEMSSGTSTTVSLKGVWGAEPNDVFAVGGSDWDKDGIILHYDGTTWREMYRISENILRGIWGSGPDDVFAVGDGGTILHYDGTAWRTMNSGTSNRLNGVWGSGPTDVFAVGSGGTILYYDGQAVINGKVTNVTDDTALSGVSVAVREYSTTTDLDGSYTLVVPPGVYTVQATPSAGMDYYANQRSFITVDNGETVTVDLKLTPITSDTVDTLILANLQRMKDIGYSAGEVDELGTKLGELKDTNPNRTNMTAVLKDLGASISPDIDAAYAAWDSNEEDVLRTNDLVDQVDNYIEDLKSSDYPNLKYLIIVGSHEVIPMKARPADSGQENEWAEKEGHLPVHSGYVYEIYRSQAGGANGHYLTDSKYGDLSFVDDGDIGDFDGELIPEIYVGRLIETPDQIRDLVDAYLSSQGLLYQEKMVSISSVEEVDTGMLAAEHMGPTADDDLVQPCFPSASVVEKIETGPDIVFLAGHSDYHRTGTCRVDGDWDQVFHAGPSQDQGSIQDLSGDLPNTVIVSVGCHNGLNLGNKLYQPPGFTSDTFDFPEAFADKGASLFFASTGYAIGCTSEEEGGPEGVCNSEDLATAFLQALLRSDSPTAGEAFKAAVNSYVNVNERSDNIQQRVLAVAVLYGIPNYRSPFSSRPRMINTDVELGPVTISRVSAGSSWSVELEIDSWALADSGAVTVSGASYMDNINTPILPVISLQRLLPAGSSISNVTWDQTTSVSHKIANDVPLPVVGMPAIGADGEITITGSFTDAGDYPAAPYFVSNLSDVGGGKWVNLQVVPVQYNQTTHTTTVWTRLSFDVEYDVASSVDSDGDGLPDYWERAFSLDPANDSGDSGADGDIDGDGLTNAEEYHHSTNPKHVDTDDDGVQDRTEVMLGTDPNNPFSKPHLIFLPIVTRDH